MRVAILDDYQDCVRTLACFAKLAEHDVLVLTETLRDEAELARAIGDAEAIVLIRERTKITRSLLERLPRLRLISQTGRHGPHIDEAACAERGVAIASGTGSPRAPAELTWALILAARRCVAREAEMLRAGRWQTSLGTTVRDRTLGVLGYGKIGALVAGFGRAFGMKVVAFGREGSRERATKDGVAFAESQRELFATSDVLTVHVRLTKETRALVSLEDLRAMKPGALFVNTSRAELVARGALVTALGEGRPGGAAIDVFEDEPTTSDPLLRLPNVLATPHLGYVERDGYELYFGEAFDNVNAFARGAPTNLVAR